MKKALEFFAWYGTIAILSAYFLNSFQLISSNSFVFQILNLTGAIGIASISFTKKNYQPAILNLTWAVIALAAIFRIFF